MSYYSIADILVGTGESMREYVDVKLGDVFSLKDHISFLLVTATKTETKHLHDLFNVNNSLPILRVHKENQTYYVGYFGLYLIVHVESSMGSIGRQASIITTSKAINFWKPKAVVMPGIAFGIDDRKQKIGDVLISETVAPYNNQRVGKEKTLFRAPIPPCGVILLNKFKNISKDWKYSEEKQYKVDFTCLLSGEVLVDNIDYRNELLKAFPESSGGEMEGAGVFAAADDQRVEWIIVKSICDFADGNKSEDKKTKQELAIKTSVSLCLHVLSTPNAFNDLGCKEFTKEDQILVLDKKEIVDVSDVIFDIYYSKSESYYITRNADEDFSQLINFFSLWLYGGSGNGKTSIIRRHLDLSDHISVDISLGSCCDYTSIQMLNYILFELEELQQKENLEIPTFPAPIIPQKIYNSFKSYLGKRKDGYIYIDEIPFNNDNEYKIFLQSIVGLLQYSKSQDDGVSIKVLLSSVRGNGGAEIVNSIKNLTENLKFIEIEKWKEGDLKALYDLIVSELSITGIDVAKEEIIKMASGSPRFIKNFLKYRIAMPEKETSRLLDLTKRELF